MNVHEKCEEHVAHLERKLAHLERAAEAADLHRAYIIIGEASEWLERSESVDTEPVVGWLSRLGDIYLEMREHLGLEDDDDY